LLYGTNKHFGEFNLEKYSLQQFPVWKMMSILPNVPEKPKQNGLPGSIGGSAHGTSSASANLTLSPVSFSGSLDASKVQTSVPPENQVAEATGTESPDDIPKSIENAQRNDDQDNGDGDWQRVHSQLSALSNEFRDAYREALRILLHDGAATERFVLKQLKQQKLAVSWSGIFSQMQTTTNLVQPIPGQPEPARPQDKEWEIRPALRAAVASYLRMHDNSRPV
jgi:hypothetical protein